MFRSRAIPHPPGLCLTMTSDQTIRELARECFGNVPTRKARPPKKCLWRPRLSRLRSYEEYRREYDFTPACTPPSVCYRAYDSSQPDASELIPAVKRLPDQTRDAAS